MSNPRGKVVSRDRGGGGTRRGNAAWLESRQSGNGAGRQMTEQRHKGAGRFERPGVAPTVTVGQGWQRWSVTGWRM